MQIDVQLSKNIAKTSEDIDISLTGKPNSFVGILGVDKSFKRFRKENEIVRATIVKELQTFYEPNRRNNCDSVNYEYYSNHMNRANAIFIANLKNHSEKNLDYRRTRRDSGDEDNNKIYVPWDEEEEPSMSKKFLETWIFDHFVFSEG
jgi:hypothetical protein